MIEKGLPPGMTQARRLQAKYLSAVASPSLASMVAQKVDSLCSRRVEGFLRYRLRLESDCRRGPIVDLASIDSPHEWDLSSHPLSQVQEA
jgi:hypothetical protein